MQQEHKRTTINLDGELYRAWKASGVPLPEVIRRGLQGTGDLARFVHIETRLALIESRLAILETRPAPPLLDVDTDETDDEYRARVQAEAEQRRRDQLERHYDQLWAKVERDPERAASLTISDLLDLLHMPRSAAMAMMHGLASLGYVTQHERKAGTGQPYRWTVLDPATVDRAAPTLPPALSAV